ncbi:phosphoribosylamine--glycine ligase [Candidatus Curtissbacteria bacterium]|nr:phosphoribosylamine--glycine ligase [Candidatus Curtissbacteria bacterium]
MAATVLVVDGGGRGSALVDKYLQSPEVSKVLATPGNDLMLTDSRIKIFPNIKTTDVKNIKKICRQYKVDLVDIAQDDAVAAGLTDELAKTGIAVFGPTKSAGQIEWDKAWARNFMRKNKIPAPAFKICTSAQQGIKFLKSQKEKEWFIKASGLAAGKGALYAKDNREAIEKIHQMKNFGSAGKTYLIEECLKGEEFSSFAIVGGADFILVGHVQDHKTVYDGDLGPNTGGMGCSSPPMVIDKKIEKQIKSIFKKAAQSLVRIGRPYRGILYLGGMVDQSGKVYVVEFNARWGDPEAQVIVPRIKNDLYEVAIQTIDGKIKKIKLETDNKYLVAVTAACKGYPTDYSKVIGKQIIGLSSFLSHSGAQAIGSIKVFGAGVKNKNGKYIAHGGRLFYVMAKAKDVADARQKAYNALSKIKIEGNNLHYRSDIGWRDVERMRK